MIQFDFSSRSESVKHDPETVLIIDDSVDIRVSLQALLELWGYRVESAEDGLQGVFHAITLRPEIAIIDISLPKMNGLEVARKIRLAHGPDDIFLIALTGLSCPSDRRRSMAAGFDAHVIKPVGMAELASILQMRRKHPACLTRNLPLELPVG